jgi:hypothetical protein
VDDQGSFPGRARIFLFRHRVQPGSGAHPASYPAATEGSFPGVKRLGREANHSPPSSTEIKNAWSYTSIPLYVFMAWCLIKDRLYFHGMGSS